MTDAETVPGRPDPLLRVAQACIILGIVSLIRFGPELVLVVLKPPGRAYWAVLALDVTVALLWLKSGRALRKHSFRVVGFAAVCGTVIFTHGVTWGYFWVKMLKENWSEAMNDPAALGFVGSRLLIYAIESGFWPFAFLQFLKHREVDAPSLKSSLIYAIVGTFLIATMLQVLVIATVLDR